MSENIRYPNITGSSEKEQLSQIKSYLYQLVEHLNYLLPTIGTGDGEQTQQSSTPSTVEVQGSNVSYYDLRSLIIRDLEQLQQAVERGDFDGEDGYTPVKGEDYFTENEVASVAKQAANKISFILDEETGYLYYEVEE